MKRIILIAILTLPAVSHADKFIVANNTRLTYDYGSDIKPTLRTK